MRRNRVWVQKRIIIKIGKNKINKFFINFIKVYLLITYFKIAVQCRQYFSSSLQNFTRLDSSPNFLFIYFLTFFWYSKFIFEWSCVLSVSVVATRRVGRHVVELAVNDLQLNENHNVFARYHYILFDLLMKFMYFSLNIIMLKHERKWLKPKKLFLLSYKKIPFL